MSIIFFSILSYILLYKYVALFFILFFAALLIPLPSNTSLLAASAFASEGYFNIYIVVLVALLANELGDITGFLLARHYGKEVLMKIGFRRIIESRRYTSIGNFIFEHSRITIYISRFIGQIGPLVNIVTGLSERITFKRFFIYGLAGEVTYVTLMCGVGYFLGSSWQDITVTIEYFTALVVGIIAIFIISKLYFSKPNHKELL